MGVNVNSEEVYIPITDEEIEEQTYKEFIERYTGISCVFYNAYHSHRVERWLEEHGVDSEYIASYYGGPAILLMGKVVREGDLINIDTKDNVTIYEHKTF